MQQLVADLECGNEAASSLLTKKERAVVPVSYGLGRVPCALESAHADALYAALSLSDVEWIVAVVALVGSFSKLMDGLGIPFEPSKFKETREMLGAE